MLRSNWWTEPDQRPRWRSQLPRDSQRQRCYDAERWARTQDPAMMVQLFTGDDTLATCAEYTRAVYADSWVRATWPGALRPEAIRITNTRARRGTAHFNNRIAMPRFARYPLYTLHEIAHLLCYPHARSEPGHSPRWAGDFLALVHRFMGFDAGMLLRAGYIEKKVKFLDPYPFTFTAYPIRFPFITDTTNPSPIYHNEQP